MHELHSGIDYFISDIDDPPRKDLKCLACGEPLKGLKVEGYCSFTSAMAGHKSRFYSYACRHASLEGPHSDLVLLIRERNGLVSGRLRAIVDKEIDGKRKAFRLSLKRKKSK